MGLLFQRVFAACLFCLSVELVANALAQDDSDTTIIFVLESGKIIRFSPRNGETSESQLPFSNGGARVTCAEICPGGDQLVIGRESPDKPLLIVDAATMKPAATNEIRLPRSTATRSDYMPRLLVCPTPDFLYYADESAHFEDSKVRQVIVNLRTCETRFLFENDGGITTPDRVRIADDGNLMLVDMGKSFWLVEIDSGSRRKELRLDKVDTIQLDVDWHSSKADVLWTSYQQNKWIFHKSTVDLGSGQLETKVVDPPRGDATLDYRTSLNQLLLAYGQGLGYAGVTLPVVTPEAQNVIDRYSTGVESAITFKPRTAYFSPSGRFVVAEQLEKSSGQNHFATESYVSSVIIVDMKDPSLKRTMAFDSVLVRALFAFTPQ